MCSLCGDLSTRAHWSEHAPGGTGAAARRRHRAARTAYARALLAAHGLGLAEWQGSYLVSNGRGRTLVAGDLAGCWAAAEALAGRPADPLTGPAAAALAEARP
jgi:hypothetical protein